MRILWLGPERRHMTDLVERCGDSVTRLETPVRAADSVVDQADFIVSYGYRHMIRGDVLERFPRRAVNLHISLLPWNRGADPNLWSFLENTPSGVTIHLLDPGIDTGEILLQQEVQFGDNETLRSTYEQLSDCIERLFIANWQEIRACKIQGRPQPPDGTYHRSSDKAPFMHLLRDGWDTPVSLLRGKAIAKG